MVNKENYVNVCIVGHSSDDSKTVIDNFINNGADFFEKKPLIMENLKNILHRKIF